MENSKEIRQLAKQWLEKFVACKDWKDVLQEEAACKEWCNKVDSLPDSTRYDRLVGSSFSPGVCLLSTGRLPVAFLQAAVVKGLEDIVLPARWIGVPRVLVCRFCS